MEHGEEATAVTEPETVVTWTNVGVMETKKKQKGEPRNLLMNYS